MMTRLTSVFHTVGQKITMPMFSIDSSWLAVTSGGVHEMYERNDFPPSKYNVRAASRSLVTAILLLVFEE